MFGLNEIITIIAIFGLSPVVTFFSFVYADSKIDKLEKEEANELQKKAFDSLHKIKLERPKY